MSRSIFYATLAVCFLYALGGVVDYREVITNSITYSEETVIGPCPLLTYILFFLAYPYYRFLNTLHRIIIEPLLLAMLEAIYMVCEAPWWPSILYALGELLLLFLFLVSSLFSLVAASPLGSIARWFLSALAARFKLALNRRKWALVHGIFPQTSAGSEVQERFRDHEAQLESLRARASQHFHRVHSCRSTRTWTNDDIDFSPLDLSPLHSPELPPAAVELLSVPLWKQLLFGVDCTAIAEEEIVDHLHRLADRNTSILRAHETTLRDYTHTCDKMSSFLEEKYARQTKNPFLRDAVGRGSLRYVRPAPRITQIVPQVPNPKFVSEMHRTQWWLKGAVNTFRRPAPKPTSELRYRLPVHRVAAIASEFGQTLGLGQQG